MTTIAELVASARGRIDELDPEGFTAEAARPDTVVVDVGEADERLDGIITGAVHVPRAMREFRADPASPYHDERLHPGRRVLLHCASGGRSALAAETLRSLRYGDVAHLAGGITAWREAGLPVLNEVVPPDCGKSLSRFGGARRAHAAVDLVTALVAAAGEDRDRAEGEFAPFRKVAIALALLPARGGPLRSAGSNGPVGTRANRCRYHRHGMTRVVEQTCIGYMMILVS